jgi:nucleoid-associated protein YgaU
MKKTVLTAALTVITIAIVILTVFCKSTHKEMDTQYKILYDANTAKNKEWSSFRYTQYKNLYDVNTGLDLTGAGTYTVKQGDTLSDISRHAYNEGFYYPIIMLASRGVVINPDKIQPGMVLTIPDLERNKANVNSRRRMKNCLNGFANIEKIKTNPNQALIDGFKKHADAL